MVRCYLPESDAAAPLTEATAVQIRGSSVLLVGRLLAMVLSGVTQVLIVRYLTKQDFGAFAYAVAIAGMCHRVLSIGHGQCLVRFLSMYDEERDYDKLYGTIVMVSGLVVSVCVLFLSAMLVLRSSLSGWLIDDPRAMTLVLILLFVGATDTLDDALEGVLAVFSRPRSIFFRKYLLTPGVLLAMTVVVLLTGSSVVVLAVGFLVTGIVGVAIYAGLVVKTLRERGIARYFRLDELNLPFRQVFGFGLPLVSTEFVNIAMYSISVIILGAVGGIQEVAGFRAILPLALLNQIVIYTFSMLFVPLASRLFTRDDREGMRLAYWQTAVWLAVLSFPVFAMTGPFARPLTVGLFGSRYAGSAAPLSVLAAGFYCNAALGFNTATLIVFGRRRLIMTVNVVCTLVDLGLDVALIPRYGALGLAWAACATLVLQNVLNQAGLRRTAGIRFFEWRYARVYVVVVVATALLWATEVIASPGLPVALGLGVAASMLVILANRRLLQAHEAFPGLGRVPVVGRFFA